MNLKKMIVTTFVATSCCFLAQAQTLKVPTPSPSQTIKQGFALAEITVEYSRPSAKGRTIYGDLVPFGKTWRTGANGATKITFGENVTVEGNNVVAGTYAIYSVPNKDSWEIMFYKDLTLGGNVSKYNAENELFRFKVKPTMLANKVETFTINIADVTANTAMIEFLWEKTAVAFKITTDFDAKVMKNIDNVLAADARPFFQAASYYYDNGKDLKKAAEWADKALEQNPKAYWVALLKAKIQMKNADKKGATTTAEDVIKYAKEDKNDDYVKMGQQIIADAKK
jgi:hypothetical protein